jgi:hypothetical protein
MTLIALITDMVKRRFCTSPLARKAALEMIKMIRHSYPMGQPLGLGRPFLPGPLHAGYDSKHFFIRHLRPPLIGISYRKAPSFTDIGRTATTIWLALALQRASTPTRSVKPDASPSSTRITVYFERSGNALSPRRPLAR